jgi:tetratricopeptide (TPR) repeat protein
MKIAAYFIFKDERENARELAQCLKEADATFALDTGSSDGTAEILREEGVQVFNWPTVQDLSAPNAFRFDEARNRLLEYIPEDFDVCAAIDCDERFRPGWRAAIERGWTPEGTHGRYRYNLFDADGQLLRYSLYDRIHARKGARWIHAAHETVAFDREPVHVYLPDLILDHKRNWDAPRGYYLELIRLAAREEPDDWRVQFMLGRDLLVLGDPREAAEQLEMVLAMDRKGVFEAEALKCMVSAQQRLGNLELAAKYADDMIRANPTSRDGYVTAARIAQSRGDWPGAYMYATTALRLNASPLAETDAVAFGALPWDIAASGAAGIGLFTEALTLARKALEFSPDDERIAENVRKLEKIVGGENKRYANQLIQ